MPPQNNNQYPSLSLDQYGNLITPTAAATPNVTSLDVGNLPTAEELRNRPGFIDTFSRKLAPATMNIAQDVGQSRYVSGQAFQGANQSRLDYQNQLLNLATQAKNTTDPVLKQKLLNIVHEGNQNVAQPPQPEFSPDVNKPALQRGLASGVELAPEVMGVMGLGSPAMGLGPEGSTAVQRILDASLQGGTLTGLRRLTSLPDETLGQRALGTAEATGLGMVLGGGLQALGEGTTALSKDISPTKVTIGPQLGGPQREAELQKVADSLPGITPGQKYASLQPEMSKLNDDIQSALEAKPQNISIEDLQSAYRNNLMSLMRNKAITPQEAETEMSDYINALYKQTQAGPAIEPVAGGAPAAVEGEGPITGVGQASGYKYIRDMRYKQGSPLAFKQVPLEYKPAANEFAVEESSVPYTSRGQLQITPTTITDKQAYEMKVAANQDTQAIFKKIKNNQPLTSADKVQLAGRNALDDAIAKVHPEVKEMTLRQSSLFDLVDPLWLQRGANHAFLGIPASLGTATKAITSGTMQTLGQEVPPASQLVAPAAIAGIPQLHPDNANYLNNRGQYEPGQQQPSIGGQKIGDQVSQGTATIPPTASKYQTPPPPQGFMVEDDYRKKSNDLTQQIAEANASGDRVTAIRLQGQKDQLDNSWALQKPVMDEWSNTNNISGLASSTYNLIKRADPTLLNLNANLDNLFKAGTSEYAALNIALQYFAKKSGLDLSKIKTEGALLSALDTAVSDQANTYNVALQRFYGGNIPNPVGNQITTGLPATNPIQPTGLPATPPANFNFGTAGQGLPAIPNQ